MVHLAKYNVDHDTINIHLNDKPDWLKEINPLAKVPVLEVSSGSNTQFINESSKINEFLIETFSSADDQPVIEKSESKELEQLFMETIVNLWYQVVYYKASDRTEELIEGFNQFTSKLDSHFLAGDKITLADYNIWVSLDYFRDFDKTFTFIITYQ